MPVCQPNYITMDQCQHLHEILTCPLPMDIWVWNDNLQSTHHQTPEVCKIEWAAGSTTEERLDWKSRERLTLLDSPAEQRGRPWQCVWWFCSSLIIRCYFFLPEISSCLLFRVRLAFLPAKSKYAVKCLQGSRGRKAHWLNESLSYILSYLKMWIFHM